MSSISDINAFSGISLILMKIGFFCFGLNLLICIISFIFAKKYWKNECNIKLYDKEITKNVTNRNRKTKSVKEEIISLTEKIESHKIKKKKYEKYQNFRYKIYPILDDITLYLFMISIIFIIIGVLL